MEDNRILPPDELVDSVVEEIIVSFLSCASLEQLWTIVCGCLNRSTIVETYKRIFWSWLVKRPEIKVCQGDSCIFQAKSNLEGAGHFPSLQSIIDKYGPEQKINIQVEESKQYLLLTNKPQEGSPIGAYPFNLLKHIISRKEKGISGAELSRVSGQDPRSLTGRLNLLEKEGLIMKRSALIGGATTNLIIHMRYFTEGKGLVHTVDTLAIRQRIVSTIKNSKNRIRASRDIAEEFQDKTSRKTMKQFFRIINTLCRNGYLKRVLVAPRDEPARVATTRALMYIKDFEANNDIEEFDDNDEGDEEEEEEDEEEVEDKLHVGREQTNDSVIDTSVGQTPSVENAIEISAENAPVPVLCPHFPLMCQFYELIRKSGPNGISAIELGNMLTGSSAQWFKKLMPDIKTALHKGDEHLFNYSIVKVLDSEGKTKFYRYFTQEEYSKLNQSQVIPAVAGEFPSADLKSTSLLKLSIEESKNLGPSSANAVMCADGIERANWTGHPDPNIKKAHAHAQQMAPIVTSVAYIDESNGEVLYQEDTALTAQQMKRLSAPPGATRGRPKKGIPMKKRSASPEPPQIVYKKRTASVQTEFKERSIREVSYNIIETLPDFADTTNEAIVKQEPVESSTPMDIDDSDTKPNSPFNINFAALGGSIRSYQRRQALLAVLESCGGAAVMNLDFRRQIGARMNLSTLIDKATLYKDIDSLLSEKLLQKVSYKEKLVLLSKGHKISDAQLHALVEETMGYNYSANRQPQEMPEVVRATVEFKNINVPKAFRPVQRVRQKAEGSKLTGERASTATMRPKRPSSRTVKQETKEKLKDISNTKRKSRQGKASEEPETDMAVEAEFDPMASYLTNIKDMKRKAYSRRGKKSIKADDDELKLRERRKNVYDFGYIMKLARAHTIVNSLAINKSVVEWKSVAVIMGNEVEPDVFRKRWGNLRRKLPMSTLPRMKAGWEWFLDQAIKNGSITFEMLANQDYKKMYDLWSETDIGEYEDDFQLYHKYEDNTNGRTVVKQTSEKIPFSSLISASEKSRYLKSVSFCRPVAEPSLDRDKYDTTKAVLKSIFSTDPEHFDSRKSRELLQNLGDYVEALKELEKSKDIAFLGEGAQNKFTISDKTWLLFQHKFSDGFLEGATSFLHAFAEVVDAGKGMVLSAMTPDHTILAIIHLLMANKMKVTLVDRVVKKDFSDYFTRNFNKQLLEVDFVLSAPANSTARIIEELPVVDVPIGAPCSRVWVEMNGTLKTKLWKNIIYTVLFHVYFSPGINFAQLYDKFRALLQVFEMEELINWLLRKHAITVNDSQGYYATPSFYTVIGY